MKKYLTDNRILAALALLCFIPLHLFALDTHPYGLAIDEMSMGYDAWCLANYGVDRNLDALPLYLKNFGGGQSALQAYLCALLIRLTGTLNPLLLRLPGALFGLLTMAFGAMLVHDLLGKRHPKAWFAYCMLYLAAPYFTMAARIGLDCNLMLGMSTVFLWTLHRAVSRRSVRWFALAGAAAGLTLYTYAVSYLVLLLFLALMLACLAWTRSVRFRDVLALAVPLGALAAPLIAIQIINMLDLPETTIAGFTLTKLTAYRASELSLAQLPQNFVDVVKCTFFHDGSLTNAHPRFWTLYPVSVPFAVIGIVSCTARTIRALRKRRFDASTPIVLWGASMLAVGCTISTGMTTNRINGIFFAVAACAVAGMYAVGDWLKGGWRRALAAGLAAAYAAGFALFAGWYFQYDGLFPMFVNAYPEGIAYIEEEQPGREVHMRTSYVSYMYAALPDPFEYDLPGQADERTYGRYLFEERFATPYDENAVYVVDVKTPDLNAAFADAGFHAVQIGDALIFTHG